MAYDFDIHVDRRGTDCEKWDGMEDVFGRKGLLPFWVADMDFRSAPEIIDALRKKVDFGVFGYPRMTDRARKAAADWQRVRHGWDVDASSLDFVPGVVTGLIAGIEAFTKPGDGVLIQTPVYPPFFKVIRNNGRKIVENPLKEADERFVMDFDNLREAIVSGGIKLMLLCSPHNPVARVWEEDELKELASVCMEHDVIILNDEIHQDLIFSDAKHIPIGLLAPELKSNLVTFVAPSKTFNIAGLSASVWIAEDEEISAKMESTLERLHMSEINMMAVTGLEAAYEKGALWLDEAMAYLEGNRDFVEEFLRDELPRVKLKHPEGTFIFWLDFRDYGLHNDELQKILLDEARVALNPGTNFGAQGDGFARLNVGCTRAQLEEGMRRIADAFRKR